MLDLRVAHDRVGRSADPTLNGHLRYSNNLDQSLHDVYADKTRRYRTEYINNPTMGVDLMTSITSTSGRLHSELHGSLFTTQIKGWSGSR